MIAILRAELERGSITFATVSLSVAGPGSHPGKLIGPHRPIGMGIDDGNFARAIQFVTFVVRDLCKFGTSQESCRLLPFKYVIVFDFMRRASKMVKALQLQAVTIGLTSALLMHGAVYNHLRAETVMFVPPPRTISDIASILDQEKPDPKLAAKMRADADASPPPGASRIDLARFLYNRCQAHGKLGEFRQAVVDCENAAEYGRGWLDMNSLGRLRQGLAIQYTQIGDPKKALEVMFLLVRETNVPGAKGYLIIGQGFISEQYIQLGDFDQAEAYLKKNQALIQDARGWSRSGYLRSRWEAEVERGKAHLFEARGRFREAEESYSRTEALMREALSLLHTYGEGLPPPPAQLEQGIDGMLAAQGRMKARQGRIAEGEADVRRALLSRLKATGKYNLQTTKYIGFLANMMVEQGRFTEAEQLIRRQLEIQQTLGVPSDSQIHAVMLSELASILTLQGKWSEAANIFTTLDDVTKGWELSRRESLVISTERNVTLYNTNNLTAGITAAERLLAIQKTRFGESAGTDCAKIPSSSGQVPSSGGQYRARGHTVAHRAPFVRRSSAHIDLHSNTNQHRKDLLLWQGSRSLLWRQ